MGGSSMIGLAEINRCKLPIGIETNFSRKNPDRGIHRVILIDLRQWVEILHQTWTIVAKAVPDKSAPSVAAKFLET